MVCFGRGEHHARHWGQHSPRPRAPTSDAGRSGADRAHDAANHIELRDRPLPPGRGDTAAARRHARCRAHGAAGRGAIRRCPPGSAAQGVHHGGRHAHTGRAVGIPARGLSPAVPARGHGAVGSHAHNRAAAAVRAGVDAAAGAAHGHASAAAALCALGAPARPGAVRPVSGNSGRQRCSARGRCDAVAAVWCPQHHGSAVFSPRRAALADAAGQ